MDRKLRIAVDCRIENAQQGVGTAVLALAKALSDSKIKGQEYTFIVREDMQDWLAPYVYGPSRLVGIPASPFSKAKARVRWIRPLQSLWRTMRRSMKHVPRSDGYVESSGFDLVHFPTQLAYVSDLPSIYQPWDLQHLHYPAYFATNDFESREIYYRVFCNRATYVCVQAEWTRQDLIQQYELPAEKVVVIPWASVFDAYEPPSTESMDAAIRKFQLPEQFFFYPAITWPHKNHEIILRALRVLNTDHNTRPHVYFTGSSTERREMLEKMAQDLEVSQQIHFLGFLSAEELQVIYKVATAMVFPSRFEGFGLPILEGFQARVPVLCAKATTLPEIAGDAALYFDPNSPSELALRMISVLDKPALGQELVRKGTLQLSKYSTHEMATKFQRLYESVATCGNKNRLRSGFSND